MLGSSESQEQMQLHKKHDKNAPAHRLWNARAGAFLRSHGSICPEPSRVKWTQALTAAESWPELLGLGREADDPNRNEKQCQL